MISVKPPVKIQSPLKDVRLAIMPTKVGILLNIKNENSGTKATNRPVINPELEAVVRPSPIVCGMYNNQMKTSKPYQPYKFGKKNHF